MEYLNTALDIQNLNLDLEWSWNSGLNGAIGPTYLFRLSLPQTNPKNTQQQQFDLDSLTDDFTTTPCGPNSPVHLGHLVVDDFFHQTIGHWCGGTNGAALFVEKTPELAKSSRASKKRGWANSYNS